MGTVYEENKGVAEENEEVVKLQNLVKKLEIQNEILKSRSNDNTPDSETIIRSSVENGTIPKTTVVDNAKRSQSHNDLDIEDLEVIDVSGNISDEDSWLFKSPKTSNARKISPYKWVRQDLEKNSPEVENTRKSLVFRLDDATRMNRNHHRDDSRMNSGFEKFRGQTNSRNNNNVSVEPTRQRNSLSARDNKVYELPEHNGQPEGSRINTNTFRLKKKPYNARPAVKYNAVPDSPDASPRDTYASSDSSERGRGDVNERVRDPEVHDRNGNDGTPLSRKSSTDESAQDPEYNKLTDVVDVQVLARMQEDSLRKSMTSPAQFANKKALSKSNLMSNSYGSNRSSPARYQDHEAPHSSSSPLQSNHSLGSLSSHSDSPSDSPYNSRHQLQNNGASSQAEDAHRRSMPNLAKTMPMSLPSHPSDPEIDQPHINTNTFTRRKSGQEKTAMSRYGSGGLAARSPGQGLSMYQRSQSPSQRNASPQRVYNVRNVSPVRQARNVSPVRTAQARNVSPIPGPRRQARNVSPVNNYKARIVSPVNPYKARNVSPVNNYRARNVSPVNSSSQGRSSPSLHTSPAAPTVSYQNPRNNNTANQRTGGIAQANHTYTKPGQTAGAGRSMNYSSPNGLRSSATMQPGAASKANNSALRSSLPAPKSGGIPRPGANSKLPSPRKLAIPASKRAALFNKSDDSSWKDGCY